MEPMTGKERREFRAAQWQAAEKAHAEYESRVLVRFGSWKPKGDVDRFPFFNGRMVDELGVEVRDGEVTLETGDNSLRESFTPDEIDTMADELKALAQVAREAE